MKNPLDIDATIVGPVVELRYASHGQAVAQLRQLRFLLDRQEELLRGAALLLKAQSPHMTHRNHTERKAYELLRAAVNKEPGGAAGNAS